MTGPGLENITREDMVNEILTMWLNSYIMSLLTALLLFGLGAGVCYTLVRIKDRENDE